MHSTDNTTDTAAPKSSKLQLQALAMISFALAALVIALYLPALHNGFINYDDPDYVTHNPQVLHGLNWDNVKWAFGTSNPAANWHPLTWMSHMLDVQVFGMNPSGHHLINILLMAIEVVLLFLFLARATGKLWPSAAVAAIYAVHPLNVEPVAWVAERKQELSLLFMFLTLLAYLSYTKRPSVARYFGVALLFTLALMSKVMIITLPFALLLLDYWPLDRFSREKTISANLLQLITEKIPLFVLSAVAGWITVVVHRKEGALTAAIPLAWRVKNAIYSYAVYLWKAVWPSRLAVFYPHPENRLPLWQIALAGLVLLIISALVWRYREKKYLTFGWLWYLGTAFPMIGLLQSGRQGMADRYEDLPLIGIYIAVVWLASDALAKHRLSPALVTASFAAILLTLVILTHRQIAFWKDSITLFTHTVQVTTRNGIAENNLGAAYMEIGDPYSAFPHFLAATKYAPDLGSAHYNLAIILQRQGQLPEAKQEYLQAIAHAADAQEAAQSHNNLGLIYLTQNNVAAARAEFDKAIALNPDEINSYIARGTLEYQLGKIDDAIQDFSEACSRSRSPIAYFWLGRAFESKGDFPHAKAAYGIALQISPAMQEARARLSSLQALTGQ
jgi:protein O-mannosyl-transferase